MSDIREFVVLVFLPNILFLFFAIAFLEGIRIHGKGGVCH